MKGLLFALAALLLVLPARAASPDIASLMVRAHSGAGVQTLMHEQHEGRLATIVRFVDDGVRYTLSYDAGYAIGYHGLVIRIEPEAYIVGRFPELIHDPGAIGEPHAVQYADGSFATWSASCCGPQDVVKREAAVLRLLEARVNK